MATNWPCQYACAVLMFSFTVNDLLADKWWVFFEGVWKCSLDALVCVVCSMLQCSIIPVKCPHKYAPYDRGWNPLVLSNFKLKSKSQRLIHRTTLGNLKILMSPSSRLENKSNEPKQLLRISICACTTESQPDLRTPRFLTPFTESFPKWVCYGHSLRISVICLIVPVVSWWKFLCCTI